MIKSNRYSKIVIVPEESYCFSIIKPRSTFEGEEIVILQCEKMGEDAYLVEIVDKNLFIAHGNAGDFN